MSLGLNEAFRRSAIFWRDGRKNTHKIRPITTSDTTKNRTLLVNKSCIFGTAFTAVEPSNCRNMYLLIVTTGGERNCAYTLKSINRNAAAVLIKHTSFS